MSKPFACRLLIAAPQGVAAKLEGILAGAQIVPDRICHCAEEALAAIAGEEALLLTTWKLDDMTGGELAAQAGDAVDVLMIVPHDFDGNAGENVLLLRNPLSPDALIQAVRTMMFCCAREHGLRAKVLKLSRTLEERKVIERAKGKLMDTLGIKESEAHYRIQKKSMDTGRRIVDIAQEILDAEEIAAD